ncbi:MAG: septal ring lytic transglycosylase RlpA family protein [Aeromonas sp.]
MKRGWQLLLCLLLTAGSAPYAMSQSQSRQPHSYRSSGVASYYADRFENRRTASGERYRKHLKTAAHNKLPLGSKVKVTNLANGKSVIVKINDRGGLPGGRIIDLSKSAFRSISSLHSGLVKVKVEVI